MKKSMKRLACLVMACTTVAPLVACGGGGDNGGSGGNGTQKHNPETQALVISTEALDGKFNPFYATSGTDVSVAAQTQIGMLTMDKNGTIVCGEDEPTVVLDYKQTMYDTKTQNTGNVTTDPSKAERTEYEFVIKNGIKFSDGVDLTIKDVLFNLYVYLDPLYTGSATIYSTKIQGLNAYRMQSPDADESANWADKQASFYNEADRRIKRVLTAKADNEIESDYDANNAEMVAQVEADYALAVKLFKEEITSDWTANVGTLENYKNEFSFTQDWEVYYYNAGLVNIEYERAENGAQQAMKDEDGKYITTLNPESDDYESLGQGYINAMNEALAGKEVGTVEYSEAMKETAIKTVYDAFVGDDYISKYVLMYWATANTLREELAGEAREKYFQEVIEASNGMPVKSISGITTYNTKNKAFTGGAMGNTLDASGHDVLKIVIDKVDPKALHNFAFTVAPMHYYADGEGKYDDYYKKAFFDPSNPDDSRTNFGVAFGEKAFFDDVLQDPEKTGKPMGAGAYMAWASSDSEAKTSKTFWNNKIVNYKRNDYFYTVGKELSNAKIKYLRYKEVGSDQLMNELKAGGVHFGTPNASKENIADLKSYQGKLSYTHHETNGYGYVGINAKYVPDINVRRMIMRTMNLEYPQAYYGSLSKKLYRSMSLTNWYYPSVDGVKGSAQVSTAYAGKYSNGDGDLTYYGDVNDPAESGYSDRDFMREAITSQLDALGYKEGSDGIRVNSANNKLEYTFTIAGGSADHPAYNMLQQSANILGECGFKITVRTDPQALIKLSRGELQVWSAAWSSAVDPDMYQVYHKDSTATSVKNWGYDEILKAGNETKYATEIEIINTLSELIEDGRETLDPNARFKIYTQALDYVMELAVEFPTYQREDLFVYDSTLIDKNTLNKEPSAISGLLDRIWEVNYL
ncbi:MAG: hypothetical protein E7368_01675 [Clostridiales bacterium]|nr:hypothetical protein [Clostridiales bacterium]